MDSFGKDSPENMPLYLFGHAVHINYATATRATIENQNYSVCPRYWYIDTEYRCPTCEEKFTWSAHEQKVWFEQFKFWIDAHPKFCRKCNAKTKDTNKLLREYTETISNARKSATTESKMRIIEIVNILESNMTSLPPHFISTRNEFMAQMRKDTAS